MSDTIVFNTEDAVKPVEVKKFKPFPLLSEKDPILSKPLDLFNFDNPPVNPNEFASALVDSCRYYQGLGLSANQCGFPYRVFVAGYGDNFVSFFNPSIKDTSEETVMMQEGCLSFPELILSVPRPDWVEAEYQDFQGVTHQIRLEGLSARVFLHEFDHMNGVLFTEKAKPLALKMALQRRQKKMNTRNKVFKNAIKQLEFLKIQK